MTPSWSVDERLDKAFNEAVKCMTPEAASALSVAGVRNALKLLLLSERALRECVCVSESAFSEIRAGRRQLLKLMADRNEEREEEQPEDGCMPSDADERPACKRFEAAQVGACGTAGVPSSSILNQPIRSLVSVLNSASVSPDSAISNDDLGRFLGIGVFPEDSLQDVLSVSLEMVLVAGISLEAISTLVGRAQNEDEATTQADAESRPWEPTRGSIVSPVDVEHVSGFSIQCLDMPVTDVDLLRDLGIRTLGDSVGISESDLIEKGRDTLRPIRAIHALWSLQANASALSQEIGDDLYSRADFLIEAVLSYLAPEPRQRRIVEGRLGLADGSAQTLEALGKQEGITRERVRQIEFKSMKKLACHEPRKMLTPFLRVMKKTLGEGGGAYGLDELADKVFELFSWKISDYTKRALIQFASKIEEIDVDSPMDLVTLPRNRCLECDTTGGLLQELIERVKCADVRNASIWLGVQAGKECTRCKGQSQRFSEGYVAHRARAVGLSVANGNVMSETEWMIRHGSKADAVRAILLRAGRPMHFTEVMQEAARLGREITERYAHAALSDSPDAILWGRGSFLHKDNLSIPRELIGIIAEEIARSLAEGIPMVSIAGFYSDHSDELQTAGVPTDPALYSCVRTLNDSRLVCTDYPWIVAAEHHSRPALSTLLEDRVMRYPNGMPGGEMRKYLVDTLRVNPRLLGVHMYRIPNVLRYGRDAFIHLRHLGLQSGMMKPICDYIDETIEEYGHVSVDGVFDANCATCQRLGITSPYLLYDLLRMFYSEHYSLPRMPYIGSNSEVARSASGQIASYIRQTPGPCSAEDLKQHFVKELGYKASTVLSAHYYDGVVRCDSQSFIHVDNLEWDADKQRTLEDIARRYYGEERLSGQPFILTSTLVKAAGLPMLPDGLEWTAMLLGDLLAKQGSFTMIGNAQEAVVPESNPDEIHDVEDLICVLLEREYDGAVAVDVLGATLREAQVINGSLTPSMLGSGDRLLVKDRMVMLAEPTDV